MNRLCSVLRSFSFAISRTMGFIVIALWLHRDCDLFVPSGRTFCFKSSFCFFNSCTLAISAWKFFFCYFQDYGIYHHCHCDYIVTVTYLCPLDALSASSLHFVSSILAHWLLVLGFVEPSQLGPTTQFWLSSSVLRNLVSREFNGLLIDSLSSHKWRQTNKTWFCLINMFLVNTIDDLEI